MVRRYLRAAQDRHSCITYDVPVIPHGHSLHAALHVIASQSPMTFPLAEFLVIKMRSYYHFEKHPPMPVRAQLFLPTGRVSISNSIPPKLKPKGLPRLLESYKLCVLRLI